MRGEFGEEFGISFKLMSSLLVKILCRNRARAKRKLSGQMRSLINAMREFRSGHRMESP